MITGAHVVLYSTDAAADRAFLRDVLELPHVDAGPGWLIFALPAAEAAVHPADGGAAGQELFLMTDDLAAAMAKLAARGVPCGPVEAPRWGRLTRFQLPGGGSVRLYEPRHAQPRRG